MVCQTVMFYMCVKPVVKVTVDSRGGGPKFKNTTLQKCIKHMHHESVIK